MTAGQILETVDSVKKNEICDSVKYGWLAEVEGRVLCEIHKQSPDSIRTVRGADDELTVPQPYSSLYSMYLISMIAFLKGEYEIYWRAASNYEEKFREYARYYIRTRENK